MRILIAGCGDVGGALAEMLVENGHEVWGLRRNVQHLPEQVNPVKADLSDPSTLEDLPRNLDMVYYTAAAGGRSEALYRSSYVTGLRNLLNRLEQQGEQPKRIIYTSSTSVYQHSDGSWVDEDTHASGSGMGSILLEGETLLKNSSFPSTAVRFAGIYGPGRTWLLRQAVSGEPRVKTPVRYTNRIHRDDCAGVLLHLLCLQDPHDLYVAVDDEPTPYFDVISWLANELDAKAPEALHQEEGGMGKRCSNKRLKESGYIFRYASYREGYPALIESFKSGA